MSCKKDYEDDANKQNFINILKIWDERMEIKRKKAEYDETVEDFYNYVKFWDQSYNKQTDIINNNHSLGLFSKEPNSRIVSERLPSSNINIYKKNDYTKVIKEEKINTFFNKQNEEKEKEIKQNKKTIINIKKEKPKELNIENCKIKKYEKDKSKEGFWNKIINKIEAKLKDFFLFDFFKPCIKYH